MHLSFQYQFCFPMIILRVCFAMNNLSSRVGVNHTTITLKRVHVASTLITLHCCTICLQEHTQLMALKLPHFFCKLCPKYSLPYFHFYVNALCPLCPRASNLTLSLLVNLMVQFTSDLTFLIVTNTEKQSERYILLFHCLRIIIHIYLNHCLEPKPVQRFTAAWCMRQRRLLSSGW